MSSSTASKRARLLVQFVMIVALVACDTFGPPSDEDACGGGDVPCAQQIPPATSARSPVTIAPPKAVVVPAAGSGGPACPTCGGRPNVTAAVGAAGRAGGSSTAGRASEWNDADAGVEPSFFPVGLSVRQIVADAMRGRIYATVAGNATSYANSLLSIDARSGKVLRDIPIGSEPTTLALSDDGSTLWVGISGAAAVRRVDIQADELTASEPNPLPTMCFNKPCIAGAMIVLPGSKDRVLAVLKESTNGDSSNGIVLLENGAPRSNNLKPTDLYGVTALSVGAEGYAYAYNGSNSGFDFYAIAISAAGELSVTTHPGLVSGYNAELVYRDELVFASSGDVVDVKLPASPMRAGRFAMPGAILPLKGNTSALSVSLPNAFGGSNMGIPVTLSLLNVSTFTLSKSAVVGSVTASTFMQPRNIVQVGEGLAFLTGRANETSDIYLLQDIPELHSH